jgi:hypothetical protein
LGVLDRLKGLVGVNKAGKSEDKVDWSLFRPTEIDFLTRGVSDVAKLPTIPFIGFKFCFDIYNYSDLLRTIIRSLVHETFRNGIIINKKFIKKCTVCRAEYQTGVTSCDVCGSNKLREPDHAEYEHLANWIKDVNLNDQTLLEVLREIDVDLNIIDNAFLCVVKNYYFDDDGKVVGAKAMEVLRASPENVNLVFDKAGRYARHDDGRLVLFCLEHRTEYHLKKEEEVEDARCPKCKKKLYPAYFRVRKGSQYIYYTNGEILHIKKFSHGLGYGLPPVFSVWQKIMILMKMDFFILTAYHLERPPKGVLIMKGNRESIDKAWRKMMEEARVNPHMIYPLIVEGGKETRNVIEWLDMTLRSQDIDFGAFREELRRTVGALWGVMPIFTGETVSGYGLANEGLQVLVTNRAVEVEQEIFGGKVLPWLCKQIGVDDWVIELIPNEMRDVVARLQREDMRIKNATAMVSLGYDIIAKMTEDGLDFDYVERESKKELPRSPRQAGRPISPRRLQRFEGEPEHGRPRIEEQRFAGESTGLRSEKSPSVAGVIGEGGQVVSPEEKAEIKKEEIEWFTTVEDEDDLEILKTFWNRAVKDYGDARRAGAIDLAGFWGKFEGVSQADSDKINGILERAMLFKIFDKDKIVDVIVDETGIDRSKAETIARTEMANLCSKARELAYKEKTNVTKFVWSAKSDACEVCQEIKNQAKDGVTLNQLRVIIEKVGGEKAREFVAHPNCRCSFVRKFGEKRWWE